MHNDITAPTRRTPDPGFHHGTGKSLEDVCLAIADAFAATPKGEPLPTLHVYVRNEQWDWHVHNDESCGGPGSGFDDVYTFYLCGPHPTPGEVAHEIFDYRYPDHRILQGFATGEILEADVL